MLVLRVLATESLHGYAIAQRIAQRSGDALRVEEGSLYPALQGMLIEGWVRAATATSDTGRTVRRYSLTAAGRRKLESERQRFRATVRAIDLVLANG